MTDDEVAAAWRLAVRRCERILGSRDDAEDCVQEAYASIHRSAQPIDNLAAWLAHVSSRRAVDLIRTRTRERAAVERLGRREPASAHDLADAVCDRAEAEWLAGELGTRLPGRAQEILRAVAAGASLRETAEALDITSKSAECHVSRARKTAARIMAPTLAWLGALRALRALRRRAGAGATATAAAVVLVAGLVMVSPVIRAPVRAPHEKPVAETGASLRAPGSPPRPTVRLVAPAPDRAPPSRAEAPAGTPRPTSTRVARIENEDAGTSITIQEEERPGEDFIETTVWCVQNFEVSPQHIGC